MDLRLLAEALVTVRSSSEKADEAWQSRQQAWADLAIYLHPDRKVTVGAKDLDFNTRFGARELILCDHLHQVKPDLIPAPEFEGEMRRVIELLLIAERAEAEAEAAQQEHQLARDALARILDYSAPGTDDEQIASDRLVDEILSQAASS